MFLWINPAPAVEDSRQARLVAMQREGAKLGGIEEEETLICVEELSVVFQIIDYLRSNCAPPFKTHQISFPADCVNPITDGSVTFHFAPPTRTESVSIARMQLTPRLQSFAAIADWFRFAGRIGKTERPHSLSG